MAVKRIFAALILLIALAGQAAADIVLIDEDFESGTDGWTLSTNASISTEQAYNGTHSVRIVHDGTGLLRWDAPLATMQSYDQYPIRVSYRLFIANSWPIDGGGYEAGLKFMRLRQADQGIQTELFWDSGNPAVNDEPLTVRSVIYGNTIDGTCTRAGGSYGSKQGFNRGSWMLVEVEYQLNTPGLANGYMVTRFDGVVRDNRQNIVLRCSGNSVINQFYVPSNIGTSSPNAVSYSDAFRAVVLDGSPLPTPTPTPTPEPTPTPGPTPTPTPTPTPPPGPSVSIQLFGGGINR